MYESIKITNGDISFNSLGQIEFASDQDAIIQDVEHRLNTVKGDLFYNLDYGISIDFSRLKHTDKNIAEIQAAVNDALLDNELIVSATIIDIRDGKLVLELILTDETVINLSYKMR